MLRKSPKTCLSNSFCATSGFDRNQILSQNFQNTPEFD